MGCTLFAAPQRTSFIAALCLLAGTAPAQSVGYADLHDFAGQVLHSGGTTGFDGSGSESPVTIDTLGNMYGTTSTGGLNGWGTVWELTASGTYIVLHDFGGTITNANGTSGPDGEYLDGSAVAIDAAGDLFGTTRQGGPNQINPTTGSEGAGIVWEIKADGTYLDLHDFGGTITNADGSQGPDGGFCASGVILDSAGNIFGAAAEGGPFGTSGPIGTVNGMLFEITTSGVYKDLHDFGSFASDGTYPLGNICFDSSGNLYGTTTMGGSNPGTVGYTGGGTVWERTSTGTYRILHNFGGTVTNANGSSGPDGSGPYAGVTVDGAGNLFGTAYFGGAFPTSRGGSGMIWELTNSGSYEDLHDFGGTTTNADGTSGPDGTNPYYGGIKIDSYGDLFGTAQGGGPYANAPKDDGGIVWEITSSGFYEDLYDFGGNITNADGKPGPDGQLPLNSVAFDKSGNLYGTACFGGANAPGGMVWELMTASDPAHIVGLGAASTIFQGGTTTSGRIFLSKPAPKGGVTFKLRGSPASFVTVPATVTAAAGSTSANFTISTKAYKGSYEAAIYATGNGISKEISLTVLGDSITSLTLNPDSVLGGGSATGTIKLYAAAPAGGWTVKLKSNLPSYINLPGQISFPAGSSSATFVVKTKAYTSSYQTSITASDVVSTQTEVLHVSGDAVSSLTISPTSVVGGSTATGTLTLRVAAPTGGWVVKLASSNPTYAGVPATVTVPAGATKASFSITTKAYTSTYTVTIAAYDALSRADATLSIKS